MIRDSILESKGIEDLLDTLSVHLMAVSSDFISPQKNILGRCIDELHELSLSTQNEILAELLLDYRNQLSFLYNKIDLGELNRLSLRDNKGLESLGEYAYHLKRMIIDYRH